MPPKTFSNLSVKTSLVDEIYEFLEYPSAAFFVERAIREKLDREHKKKRGK